ncbi:MULTISPECIES: DNA-binding transcriptional regulator [Halomonadaceae]|uniref:helix-turn-helix domain-containing protein n=1 Tax=Halomonadaceae TaxID=28256 RepID=UPI001FB2E26C|nr:MULTISPECIES: helix-turn-helix domain-containing protein [Halomonas]MCP1319176.1 helix-turn-helix domain-containing protein [Halomonas sp. 707B3]
MDEALFFSLQLEKFPGHEEVMRQFADANGIPFDLALIYQLIEDRRRDEQRHKAEEALARQDKDNEDCLGSWRSYNNAKRNLSAAASEVHQTLHAKPEHSDVLRQETPWMTAVVAHRRAQGITQAEFARQLGVSVRTYQEWEQGRRQPSGPAESILRRALS